MKRKSIISSTAELDQVLSELIFYLNYPDKIYFDNIQLGYIQGKFYEILGHPNIVKDLEKEKEDLEKEKEDLEEALNAAEDNYLEEKERCEGLEKTIKLLEREKED